MNGSISPSYASSDTAAIVSAHLLRRSACSNTPVLFLGGLKDNVYLNKNNTEIEAKKIYSRTWGFICESPTIWWGNLDNFAKILYEYEGVNMKLVSESESSEILETEEFKTMKHYPEKNSIKVINNTVVVKLSDY